MKLILATTLLAALAGANWLAATNSRAATKRGIEAYERGDFAAAAKAFTEADRLEKSEETALNRGTAEIAAGEHAAGLERLSPLVGRGDAGMRALFNRGTGSLLAGEPSSAVADLSEYLRMRPQDRNAKRNLELALREQAEQKSREQQQRRQQEEGGARARGEDEEGAPESGGQQQKPSDGTGEIDAEALLRSVAQQEREELSRMRRAGRQQNRVGW